MTDPKTIANFVSMLSATEEQKAAYLKLRAEFDAAVKALGVVPMYDYCDGGMYLISEKNMTDSQILDALAEADGKHRAVYSSFVESNYVDVLIPWFTDSFGEIKNFAERFK